MSRKAMKKTLERLGAEVLEDLDRYLQARNELDKAPTNRVKIFNFVMRANTALVTFGTYAQALKDAYEELAEPLDKKLEKMKKAVETIPDKPTQKKDKTKNQIYT